MTRASVALAAALLSGCAAGPTAQPAPAPAAAVAPPAPAAAASAPILAPPVPAPSIPPDPSVGRLAGLGPGELTRTFGAPGFVRRDRGVEVWQYRSAACVLHLFLYGEAAAGLRVTHAEARDAAGRLIADAATVRDCVGAVSAQRAVG